MTYDRSPSGSNEWLFASASLYQVATAVVGR